MKAKTFLKWFIENGIENTTGEVDYIDVPEAGDDYFQSQKDFLETFFGSKDVKRHIPGGEYVYIWWNENNSDALLKILDSVEMIVHSGEDPIYLFRIED